MMESTTDQLEQVKEALCTAMGYEKYRYFCPGDREIYGLLDAGYTINATVHILLVELTIS